MTGTRHLGLFGVLLGLVAAVVLGLSGLRGGSDPAQPLDDSAAAGFARDMQVHHAQAVEMSMIVRDRTDDPEIRRIAYDIALGQQQQIGQMFAWLQLWGLSQTGLKPPMTWAGHDMSSSGSVMPGMITPGAMKELSSLRGERAEVWFLTRMIEHHRGGVSMAQAALRFPVPAEVRRMAETMIRSQSAEIEALGELLAQRPLSQRVPAPATSDGGTR